MSNSEFLCSFQAVICEIYVFMSLAQNSYEILIFSVRLLKLFNLLLLRKSYFIVNVLFPYGLIRVRISESISTYPEFGQSMSMHIQPDDCIQFILNIISTYNMFHNKANCLSTIFELLNRF